jgi:uncharacterized protein (TIGR02391 family)
MADDLLRFERIARIAYRFTERESGESTQLHPFDQREVHECFPKKVRKLFDDGHYAEATYAAFKFLDKLVQRLANSGLTGTKLMNEAFKKENPVLKLTPLSNESEVNEQEGYRAIFYGAIAAIRNPRGHEVAIIDEVDTCLDHLAFASMLVRRLEQSGFKP